ncbi:unnamed protein product, partial [Symbiodinium sp. CCMP2592]
IEEILRDLLDSAPMTLSRFIQRGGDKEFYRWLKTAPDQRGLILQCLLGVDTSALALGTAWPKLQEALFA